MGSVSGVNTFDLNLGSNGSNHFNVTAANEEISSVALFALGGFTDLRQPRIETVNGSEAAVPEPSTATLLAIGLVAVILGRSRGVAKRRL
jgi:hypothetical protein